MSWHVLSISFYRVSDILRDFITIYLLRSGSKLFRLFWKFNFHLASVQCFIHYVIRWLLKQHFGIEKYSNLLQEEQVIFANMLK